MRPPVGPKEDEQLAPIEALLREAAEFEAEAPPPGLLTAGGIALLLAEETAKRRRAVRSQVAAFAALLTGAAACSASLVLALNQPSRRAQTTVPRPDRITAPAPAVRVAEKLPDPAPAVASPAGLRRPVARRQARSRRVRYARKPSAPSAPPAAPVWTETTVEHQVTGVLARAWLVQPDEEGGLQLTPALVDLTLDPAACELTPEPAAEAPASPELNVEENEAR
jgi:hypothetical protein